jgi:hypothetical protein
MGQDAPRAARARRRFGTEDYGSPLRPGREQAAHSAKEGWPSAAGASTPAGDGPATSATARPPRYCLEAMPAALRPKSRSGRRGTRASTSTNGRRGPAGGHNPEIADRAPRSGKSTSSPRRNPRRGFPRDVHRAPMTRWMEGANDSGDYHEPWVRVSRALRRRARSHHGGRPAPRARTARCSLPAVRYAAPQPAPPRPRCAAHTRDVNSVLSSNLRDDGAALQPRGGEASRSSTTYSQPRKRGIRRW